MSASVSAQLQEFAARTARTRAPVDGIAGPVADDLLEVVDVILSRHEVGAP